MNWRSALVINSVGFFLFAIGGSTVYAAAPQDACSLRTADQVSSVLGTKVGTGQHVGKVEGICQWSAAQAGGPPKSVEIGLLQPWAFDDGKMRSGPGFSKSDVSGIGDDAFYQNAHGGGTTLNVKKGNAVFFVRVAGFPDDQIKAKEKTLALDIVAKL